MLFDHSSPDVLSSLHRQNRASVRKGKGKVCPKRDKTTAGFCLSGLSAAVDRDFSIYRNYHKCVGLETLNWTRSGNKVALAVVGLRA